MPRSAASYRRPLGSGTVRENLVATVGAGRFPAAVAELLVGRFTRIMPCECPQLPDIVKLDDHPAIGRFAELEMGDWVRLVRCPRCGQLWSVDEWDKYQPQFAVRIPQREGWREIDTTPFRRQYLIESRGGLTDESCIWQGCEQRRVRGVVYCADHLYQTGARE